MRGEEGWKAAVPSISWEKRMVKISKHLLTITELGILLASTWLAATLSFDIATMVGCNAVVLPAFLQLSSMIIFAYGAATAAANAATMLSCSGIACTQTTRVWSGVRRGSNIALASLALLAVGILMFSGLSPACGAFYAQLDLLEMSGFRMLAFTLLVYVLVGLAKAAIDSLA